MKIEFYINDKTDIDRLLDMLAISITLNTLGIHTIYINDKEYDLLIIREKYKRKQLRVLKDE